MHKWLEQIDPGTGLMLKELIDAFIADHREAKRLKAYLSRNKAKDRGMKGEQDEH